MIEKVDRVCSAHAATGVQPEHGPVTEGHDGLGGFGTDTLGIIVRSARGPEATFCKFKLSLSLTTSWRFKFILVVTSTNNKQKSGLAST